MVSHTETPNWPTVGPIRRFIGRLYLRMNGWRAVGTPPREPKAVLIAAPHTSYWDAVYMLGVAWALNIHVTWAAKHTIFFFPFRRFFRFLGAIPIDRTSSTNKVDQLVDALEQSDKLWLTIAPAGTRRRTDHWKSGFYHVARGANVKIMCAFLDFEKKIGGLGPLVTTTGDITADMDQFRAFYADKVGRYPERKSEIRLRGELPESSESKQLAS